MGVVSSSLFAKATKSEEEVVVPLPGVPEHFRTIFTPKLLALAQSSEQVCITGGAVMALGSTALGFDVDAAPCVVRDVDVFILGSEGLHVIMNTLLADAATTVFHDATADGRGCFMVRNPSFSSAPLQLVFGCMGMTPANVLASFDMDACCARVKGSDAHPAVLTLTPACMDAWRTRVTKVINPQFTSPERIMNVQSKGFVVKFPEMDEEHKDEVVLGPLRAQCKEKAAAVYVPSSITQAMLREDTYVKRSLVVIGQRLRVAVKAGMLCAAAKGCCISAKATAKFDWYAGIDSEDRKATVDILVAKDPMLATWIA